MSYLALYRKYRPSSFEDLVGQNYVSDIIKKEILNNQISHAYLFSGPRGTGKTSTAKIISKMINCVNLSDDGVPCGKCDNCININNNNDVVEIDAASNNGVDEIRELRDKVNLVPTTSKYKIYIIDEVHMLTNQAFNALLKTLEEPPSHVIFILATTELHKIPITVVSRCQKFQFSKFSDGDIVGRLRKISELESIDVSDDVLYEIARLSDGGLRDAINMLDQLSSYKVSDLSVQDVYKLNGVVSYDDIYLLLKDIYENNVTSIISFIENLDRNGNSIVRFLEDFIVFLKDVMLYINSSKSVVIESKQEKIELISEIYTREQIYDIIFSVNDLLNKIKGSSCPSILVITFFLNLSLSLKDNVSNLVNVKKEIIAFDKDDELQKADRKSEEKSIEIEKNNVNNDFEISESSRKLRINNAFATASKSFKDSFISNWSFIESKLVDSKYGAIAGLLNDVEVAVVGDGYIIMLAKYDSLIRRLYNNLNIIEDLLFDSYNKRYKLVFLVSDEWLYEKNKYVENLKKGIKYNIITDEDTDLVVDNKQNSDIDKIVSIFGNDVIEYK